MKTQDLRISKNLKNKIRKTSLSFEQAALTFCLLILVEDYTLEPLSIGQVSFRSYLQSKKIYYFVQDRMLFEHCSLDAVAISLLSFSL